MNTAKAQYEMIGEALVTQYFNTFDSNRELLLPLYAPDAMFTFEEFKGQGHPAIKEILTEKLRFGTIQHVVTKVDCQPAPDGSILALVTGRLKTDEDPPHAFSQVFLIKPMNGSYFICHDLFRLSIHNTL